MKILRYGRNHNSVLPKPWNTTVAQNEYFSVASNLINSMNESLVLGETPLHLSTVQPGLAAFPFKNTVVVRETEKTT